MDAAAMILNAIELANRNGISFVDMLKWLNLNNQKSGPR